MNRAEEVQRGCGKVCVPAVGTERCGVVAAVALQVGQRWSDNCTQSAAAGRDDRLGWTLVACRDQVPLVKIFGCKKTGRLWPDSTGRGGGGIVILNSSQTLSCYLDSVAWGRYRTNA